MDWGFGCRRGIKQALDKLQAEVLGPAVDDTSLTASISRLQRIGNGSLPSSCGG